MIHALLGSILFLVQPCFADVDLSQVDTFLQGDTFDAAFHNGDLSVIETKSCIGAFCDSPYDTQFSIKSVSPDQALCLGAKMDGSPISQVTILGSDWRAMSQNRIRFEIHSLELGGFKVTLNGINSSSATVVLNGNSKTVPTRVVRLEARGAAGLTIQETVEVASGLGGMGQLVSKVVDHGTMGTDTFTVLRIVRESVGSR